MQVLIYEMTRERRKKLEKVCAECIDLLARKLEGPEEAMIAMRYMLETLEEAVHMRLEGRIDLDKIDPKGPPQ